MFLCLDVFENISYLFVQWELMDVVYNTELVCHTDLELE
jgi:hypothetical protein